MRKCHLISFDFKINSCSIKLEKKTVYNELREAIRTSNLIELVENGTNIYEAWEKWKHQLNIINGYYCFQETCETEPQTSFVEQPFEKIYKKQKS